MGSEVGENIRKIRKQRRMSQKKLAEASGISQSAISDIENPDVTKRPNTDTISKLAIALDCTVGELMGESESGAKEYTHEELRLLSIVQRLNSLGVQKVIEYAADLADNEKYTQETPAAASAG